MAIQTFVASTVLTAAQMNALQGNDYNQTVSTKTASYTLVAADKGTKIVMNSASATTITVNTSLFSAGDTLTILNIAAGVCTVTAGTATVSSAGSLALAQNAGGTLYFTSAGVSVFQANGVTASASGLTFITGASFTTATSFSLPTNTFSSVYQNYKFVVNITAVTADADFSLRLRASGTDSTAGYYTMLTGLNASAGASDVGGDNISSFSVGESDNTVIGYSLVLDVIAPQLAVNTTLHGSVVLVNKPQTTVIARSGGFFHFVGSAFDSLTFISSVASSITGNYKVYGYANS